MGDVMDGTYIFCLSDPRLYLLRLLRVHRELVLVLLPLPSRQRKEHASSSTRTNTHRQRRAKKLNTMRANTYEYDACGGLKATLEIAAPGPGTYTDTPRPECEDTNRKCTHKRVSKRHPSQRALRAHSTSKDRFTFYFALSLYVAMHPYLLQLPELLGIHRAAIPLPPARAPRCRARLSFLRALESSKRP